MERQESRHIGTYRFAIRWIGCLEKDDHDYLLYRINSELCNWEAEETEATSQNVKSLRTTDFREKPRFKLQYIIRKENNLHLDFIVDRLIIPQDEAEDALVLLLPSSEENDQHNLLVNYNACVLKGSNRVFVEERKIYSGPIEKDFTWTWKLNQWLPESQGLVFTSQGHRVKVSLAITPHFSRRP